MKRERGEGERKKREREGSERKTGKEHRKRERVNEAKMERGT